MFGASLPGVGSVAHADVLVSNLGQSRSSGGATLSPSAFSFNRLAQKFRVEASKDYTLTDVVIDVHNYGSAGISVAIHDGGSTNPPNSSLYTLTAPASPGTGQQTYTAPPNATLEKDKRYFVVLKTALSSGDSPSIKSTTSDAEDASGVSGWSIGNTRRVRNGTTWSGSDPLRIAINGKAIVVGTPITATLTALDPVEGADGRLRHSFDLKLSEPVIKSFRKMRNSVFTGTNGTVTKARRIHRERRYDSDAGRFRTYSNHWRLEVRPTNLSNAVTVAMTANRACTEAGALCTPDGGQLGNAPSLTFDALGGDFPEVSIANATANENDATLNFTVTLSRASRHNVAVDFETISGGTATEGTDYWAQDFRVFFGYGETTKDVGVALIADTVNDVGETVKVRLSNAELFNDVGDTIRALSITTAQATGTINAPAATTTNVSNLTIRINNTTGDEDDGWLDFSVSLSRTYSEYVCFDFETLTTGTATEGTDYGKRPKVLDWVRPGKTSTTAFVRIIDDHVSDSGETVKVRISNARLCDDASMTVTINRAEATGTIYNSDPMPQAWLARFGRTVADQVIDAVDGRLGAAHRPGVAATLAGQSIAGAPEADGTRQSMAQDTASRMRLEAVTSWLRGDTGESRAGLSGSQAVSERDLLAGTAFSMTGKTQGGGLVALWGRGASTSFDGRESPLSVDGEVANLMLGADWSGGALTAGLMLSHARGSGVIGARAMARSSRR